MHGGDSTQRMQRRRGHRVFEFLVIHGNFPRVLFAFLDCNGPLCKIIPSPSVQLTSRLPRLFGSRLSAQTTSPDKIRADKARECQQLAQENIAKADKLKTESARVYVSRRNSAISPAPKNTLLRWRTKPFPKYPSRTSRRVPTKMAPSNTYARLARPGRPLRTNSPPSPRRKPHSAIFRQHNNSPPP